MDGQRDAVMENAPWRESIRTSLERLSAAILADGAFDCFCPASVWYAYTRHPSLMLTKDEAVRRWRVKERPFAPVDRDELRAKWQTKREERHV